MESKILKKFFLIIFVISLLLSVFNIVRVSAKEPSFKLSNASILDKSSTVEASIESFSDNKLITNTTFHKVDDYVKYNLTIKNTSDIKYKLVLVDDNNSNENVSYEYDYDENEELLPDSTIDVILTITYNNGVTKISERDQNQEVKISFVVADENGNTYEETITNNPKTSDRVYISFILLAISIIGIVVCVLCYRKTILPVIIIAMILVPAVVSATTFMFDIILSTNYSLFDKVSITYVVDDNETTIISPYGNILDDLGEFNKDNYNFIGWTYEDGSEFDITKPITSDVKIIAKFEKKQASIIFNNNAPDSSASGEMDNQTIYLGEESSISSNMFTRAGYKFTGWNTKPDGSGTHYNDSDLINLNTEGDINLYAEWIELSSMLLNGADIHDLLSELNDNLTEFKKSETKPDLNSITYKIISTTDSNFPVYVWDDNNIIYWWSEAEKVYMDSNSNYMFYAFSKLTNVDFTGLDSSQVTTMDFMFQYCSSLTTMDLRLDTSNVVSMDAMFANCTGLESIDFSHINTSKVENYHGLVAGCSKLANINLSNFHTEGAKNFESMFSTLPNLTEIDLSSFSTPNLESIYFMFLRCTNLTTIYATDQIDLTNITDTRGALSYSLKIVGGAGTVYSAGTASNVNYFRIDDPDNGKPGYLTLKNARYIRYDGNGADGGEEMLSHYLTSTTPGNLKTNTYTKTGQTFVKWNTMSDGSGDSYTDGQLMNTLEPSKIPLTLYAIWE